MSVRFSSNKTTPRLWRAVSFLALTILVFAPFARAQTITFNLKDAEIATVIGTIAEITGKNFIIDPRVKGKATVISSRPMSKDEAYQVFLSLLEVHGFATVEVGKTIKVVPDVNAKQSSTGVSSLDHPGIGDEIVTQVIPVEYVIAAQLVPILRPLVPQQGHLVAYAPSNVLIISDRAANINRLVELIRRIDKPSADSEVELISLQHASAAEVVRILTSLAQQEKQDPAAQGTLEAQVMVADERTNSVLLGGDKSRRVRFRALIAHLDTPLQQEGNIHVVYLKYAKAKDMVPVLTGLGNTIEEEKKAQKGKEATKQSGNLNIQADETTNAVVITAPPDVFRSLQSVIRQLDIRRAQVAVEAIIVEVTARRASELGVQWLFDGTPSGDRPVGAVNFTAGTSISSVAQGARAAIVGAGNAALEIPAGFSVGFGKFDSSRFNFAAFVNALSGDSSVNVLSTPTIMTMDNVEAEIKVGQVVPFVTGSYTSVAGGSSTPTNPFQTINREDVGIVLKVTPQINEGDAIKLEIEQEVSSLAPSESGGGQITNNRSIKTTVLVADGQTVVLGGLIRDDANENQQKVPLLGDIPLLGALFRYNSHRNEKSNLMVFIRPSIMRDAAVLNEITHDKYNFMRGKQLESAQDKGKGSSKIEDHPLLPLLKEPPPVLHSDVSSDSGAAAARPPVVIESIEINGMPAPIAPSASPGAAAPAGEVDTSRSSERFEVESNHSRNESRGEE